ncbi:PQQ-dependent sugar dehydrogenase [Patescibacteria group bacterium]|nr:PQQ-dependent sugar dehydrogenase [Patescibacteria group bacterium]
MQKPKHLLAIIGTFFIFAALPLTVYLVLTSQERAREGPQAAVPLQGDFEDSIFVSGLSQPTSMAFAPDGRLFVTEKGGNVRVIKDGKLLSTPFLTVSVNTDRERGLIGVALDPDFENNGYVYIHYTHQVNTTTVRGKVSRFTASSDKPDVAVSSSEEVILGNIFSGDGHHDGGGIHFGKDGFLYIATGDGGNDFGNNSQNLGNLAGKILRINKDGSIPSDNPFAGQTGKRGEIWAYGLRNPFTFNIDPVDGKIFANDVGQSTWEEVNKIEKGANYGWPGCEGPALVLMQKITMIVLTLITPTLYIRTIIVRDLR